MPRPSKKFGMPVQERCDRTIQENAANPEGEIPERLWGTRFSARLPSALTRTKPDVSAILQNAGFPGGDVPERLYAPGF